MEKAILTQEEITLAKHCLAFAMQQGADAVRITLTKSLMNLVGLLNGEVDKTAHALDRSLQLQLFVEGRFGSFSSNRLEKEGLEAFIREAIGTVKMLEADAFRALPAPERLAKDAVTGRELGLYDTEYESLTAEKRREMALSSMAWPRLSSAHPGNSWKLISEEGEYSDSVFDSLTLDSQGLEARHTETSFEIGYESTVEDSEGRHFSSYWWDATPRLKDLQLKDCAEKACQRAVAQLDPQGVPSGKYTLILESECASKVVTLVLNALGGYSLQQKNSFLTDSLGKQLFPEGLTILDAPRTPGDTGCRLFDSEGVATREMPIIQNGVVKTYFLNTYISRKMEMEPTVEDATRVKVLPFGGCRTQEEVLAKMRDGILVTGFNGGNSNPATGNFSYGIEGFLIKDGKRVHPVREMLITGNFLTLWNNLVAVADDARPCLSKLVPTLAFKEVDFSA
ncbi:MAG: TldD/PmbA family protein [Bacteroidales bacterium]|nr:TldD/PmbA family protein [Bacteroidales bacterium]MBQ2172194.1 TldD/PmbA family protein [Bacteroidales bacterium]